MVSPMRDGDGTFYFSMGSASIWWQTLRFKKTKIGGKLLGIDAMSLNHWFITYNKLRGSYNEPLFFL